MSVSIINKKPSKTEISVYASNIKEAFKNYPEIVKLFNRITKKDINNQIKRYINPFPKLIQKLIRIKPRRMVDLNKPGEKRPELLYIIWPAKEVPPIGKGDNAKCVFASNVSTGQICAAVIRPVGERSDTQTSILEKIQKIPGYNDFLVLMYGHAKYTNTKGVNKCVSIQEYISKGTLQGFVKEIRAQSWMDNNNEDPLTQEQKIEFGIKLFTLIDILHKMGISLRDIKDDNFLIKTIVVDGKLVIFPVINDLDWACEFANIKNTTSTIIGALQYLKPNTIQKYETKELMTKDDLIAQDIWATTLVFHYFAFGENLPWIDQIDILEQNQSMDIRTKNLKKIKNQILTSVSKMSWNTSYEKNLGKLFDDVFNDKFKSTKEIIDYLKGILIKPELKKTKTFQSLRGFDNSMEVK